MAEQSQVNGVRVAELEGTIEAARQDPKVAATSWTAKSRWLGGVKSEVQCRNHTLRFDEPTVVGGDDSLVSPHETVLAAYGGCLTVGIAVNCARAGINLKDLQVELKGSLDIPGFLALENIPDFLDKVPGYKEVTAQVTIQADAPAEVLQKIVNTVFEVTPVGGTLKRPVKVVNSVTVK